MMLVELGIGKKKANEIVYKTMPDVSVSVAVFTNYVLIPSLGVDWD